MHIWLWLYFWTMWAQTFKLSVQGPLHVANALSSLLCHHFLSLPWLTLAAEQPCQPSTSCFLPLDLEFLVPLWIQPSLHKSPAPR